MNDDNTDHWRERAETAEAKVEKLERTVDGLKQTLIEVGKAKATPPPGYINVPLPREIVESFAQIAVEQSKIRSGIGAHGHIETVWEVCLKALEADDPSMARDSQT